MRLYLKASDESEITDIEFLSVVNKMTTGGAFRARKHDVDMAAVATMKKLLNQRVEVRKADGTTVIWEGSVTDIEYDTDTHYWVFGGPEGLAMLYDIGAAYNANLGSGVVTDIDDDDTPPKITDSSQTFAASLVGAECIFTAGTAYNWEGQYPTNNSQWIANAPGGGGTAADSTTTTWSNMSIGGTTASVALEDSNERGNNYYALELEFDFTGSHTTANRIEISLQLRFQVRSDFAANGSDLPEIWLYDDDGASWQTSDGNGVTGLGKLSTWSATQWGASVNRDIRHTFFIDNTDIAGYLDGNGVLKVQITCGGPLSTDSIECYFALARMRYGTLYAAEAIDYTIDIVDGSTLTFTGQTPYADKIRAGDTFRIGQDVDTILDRVWRDAFLNWIDIETDGATGLVECMDLRSSTIGAILTRYAEALNWEVWQEVGWNIRLGDTYDATGLSLTHADFKSYRYGVFGKEVIIKGEFIAAGENKEENIGLQEGITGVFDISLMKHNLQSFRQLAVAAGNILTRHSTLKQHFRGLLDHDAGTDYSAIGLGEKITITLHTDKAVFTDAIIEEISWSQTIDGHLLSEIQVFI
jgi:hypothetical protein